MSSTRTNTKNIRKELTALGQEDLSDEIEKINKVKGELDIENSKQLMDRFDESLDDAHGDVEIGSLKYSASRVLKKLDLTAYLMMLDEYVDNMVTDEEISEAEEDKIYDFVAEIDRNLKL